MKRIFIVEFDDELGPMWMNKDNLKTCLNSPAYCGPNLITDVKDVTDRYNKLMKILTKIVMRHK